ncbi:hypothetical protein HG530_011450 [Fusarium avenaceum]|nr:hypothetical protein HG530_011450 [Fusarium avenaceum]
MLARSRILSSDFGGTATNLYNIVILFRSLQVLLNLALQPIEVIDHNLAKVTTASFLNALCRASHSISKPCNFLSISPLLEAIACSSILGGGSKVVMLGAHVVNPGTADGFALRRSFAGEIVQVRDSSGKFGDRCIFVAVHNSLLPKAFLTLCK